MALPRTAAVRESGDSLPLETSQVKEFVSYDDRNFYFPAVSYANADTNASEVLDVIFKVHNGVESDNAELIRAHNDVLTVLSESGIMVPEPLPVKEGRAEKIGWIHLKRLRDEGRIDDFRHKVGDRERIEMKGLHEHIASIITQRSNGNICYLKGNTSDWQKIADVVNGWLEPKCWDETPGCGRRRGRRSAKTS